MSSFHLFQAGLASPFPGDGTAQLQALYNSMTASKELVRVLANVLAPGALSPTAASLLAALRSELDAARARARQIAREQRRCGGGGDEAERLREEMRAWKSRHREKAAAAARVVASELDAERRARQRAERVGKKLGEALAEAEAALREARREVDRERNARERMEKACDELAAGVGLGGAAAAEEYEMGRDELEREREMLQLADELREERVRMKLAEARVQFEERNAVVDRLRQELEAFLGRNGPESPARDDDRHRLQLVLASEPFVHGIDPVAVAVRRNGEDRGGGNDGEADDDYSDGGSDIELNVDSNDRDYSTASVKDTATTGKNAASRHGSFSDRGTEGGGVFDRRSSQGLGDVAQDEQRWNDDDDDGTTVKDVDEDSERYEAIKNLREKMLAGHGFVLQGGADAYDTDSQHRLAASFVCQVDDRGLW
jgi:hypothetical protein